MCYWAENICKQTDVPNLRFCCQYPLINYLDEDPKGLPSGQYILLWTHLEIQNTFPYQVLPAHIMLCQSTIMKTPTFQKQNTDLSDQSDKANIRKVISSNMILPRLFTKTKRKCWDKYNLIICLEIKYVLLWIDLICLAYSVEKRNSKFIIFAKGLIRTVSLFCIIL